MLQLSIRFGILFRNLFAKFCSLSIDEAERRFAGWLTENLEQNPLKCEYFLPLVISELIDEGKATVKILHSRDKWFGVTYREDKPTVVAAIAQKTQDGLYPEDLWN